MAGAYIEIGDKVRDSPQGPGTVTGISDAGYPRVNNVAVAWLERDDGAIFDPRGVREKQIAARLSEKVLHWPTFAARLQPARSGRGPVMLKENAEKMADLIIRGMTPGKKYEVKKLAYKVNAPWEQVSIALRWASLSGKLEMETEFIDGNYETTFTVPVPMSEDTDTGTCNEPVSET